MCVCALQAALCLCLYLCRVLSLSRMCEKEVLRYHLRLFVFTPWPAPRPPPPSLLLRTSSLSSSISPPPLLFFCFFFAALQNSGENGGARKSHLNVYHSASPSFSLASLYGLSFPHSSPLCALASSSHLLSPISTHFRLHFVNQTNNGNLQTATWTCHCVCE